MRNLISTRMAPAVVGLLAVGLLAAQLVDAPRAHATSSVTWAGRIAADQRHLERITRDERTTAARVARDVDGLRRASGQVSRRLSVMYEAGGVDALDHVNRLLGSGLSVSEATAAADAMRRVARLDRSLLDRYRRLSRELPRLRRHLRSLHRDQAATTRRLRRERASLRSARAAEAAARAAALAAATRLAASPESPFANAAVSPETVAAVTAGAVDRAPQPSGMTGGGMASVYSNSLAGQPTSSGEPYDPGAMTAASPSLPLGSWVTVTGPGGSVVVRINDRGPFVGGRVLDLSAAAAAAIGLGGLGHVSISVR